jgi:protein-disulfide isomerase
MTQQRRITQSIGFLVLLAGVSIPSEGHGGGKSDRSHHETLNESKAASPGDNQLPPDVIIGLPSASVDMIVYGAFTCSHCAEFHLNVLPLIQKEFVDTGHVRLIVRDFPMDKASLAASVIAHSQDRETYLQLAHLFFKDYEVIVDHENPLEHIKKLALSAGLTEKDIERALGNKALEEKVLNGVVHALTHYKIEATPTVIVGDKIISHAPEYKELKKVIEGKLRAKDKK